MEETWGILGDSQYYLPAKSEVIFDSQVTFPLRATTRVSLGETAPPPPELW